MVGSIQFMASSVVGKTHLSVKHYHVKSIHMENPDCWSTLIAWKETNTTQTETTEQIPYSRVGEASPQWNIHKGT